MNQFFVNNQEIVLPDNFSITFITENPLVTNNGEFTLDVTVSLLEPRNAIAFRFLNRLNNTVINKQADARSIIDGKVRSGIIVVSKNNDIEVTFQFIAGNSELNYISKTEKKIWELDWGTEQEITFERALDSVNNWHWTKNFVCTPIKAGSEVLNEYNYALTSVTDDLIVMQPYLLYYINKLPELLGYTMQSNLLVSDIRLQRMFVVNPVASLKYADCLPDMTISDFIKAIEDFFNVTFIVSSFDKTISIVRTTEELATKKRVIGKTVNSWSRELTDGEEAYRFGYTKISYDLPGNKYFDFQRISDEIMAKCKIIEYTGDIPTELNLDKFCIYRNLSTGEDWINSSVLDENFNTYGISLTLGRNQVLYYTHNVNKFRDYGTSDKNLLKLTLTPSAMFKGWQNGIDYSDNNKPFEVITPMGESSNGYLIPENKTLIETIEGSAADITRSKCLETCMYGGLFNITSSFIGEFAQSQRVYTDYPFSFIDSPKKEFNRLVREGFDPQPPFRTMRLVGPNSVVSDYHTNNLLDVSKEYVFTLLDGPDVSIDNIFIINNLEYLPISFEYNKSNNQKTVLGRFYRIIG